MKIHSDKAMEKFVNWVNIADGDAYLVYLALSTLPLPTDENIEEFIHMRKNNNARNINK